MTIEGDLSVNFVAFLQTFVDNGGDCVVIPGVNNLRILKDHKDPSKQYIMCRLNTLKMALNRKIIKPIKGENYYRITEAGRDSLRAGRWYDAKPIAEIKLKQKMRYEQGYKPKKRKENIINL